MKNTPPQPDLMKRKLLTLLASLPLFAACSANSSNLSTDPEDVRLRKKFRGIYGFVLVLDATSKKEGVTFTDEMGRYVVAPVLRARATYEKECVEQGIEPDTDFLVDLHPHDLRHEATTRLADKFAMHELAKITGHRDTRMLLRYSHPSAEDLAKRLA